MCNSCQNPMRPLQPTSYRVPQHQGFIEQALPTQYHATMKVASSLPPTSLRGIQHQNQNTDQATRLVASYSTYKAEAKPEMVQDEELEAMIESDKAIAENLENMDNDILEMEEIKHCNFLKRFTDQVTGAKQQLLFSREIPVRSMEIQGQPFNAEKSSSAVQWLRFDIIQKQDTYIMNIQSPFSQGSSNAHFVYSLIIDQTAYLDLQK